MKLVTRLLGLVLFSLLISHTVNANICGTDYQTFNPTSSGLDFVTVHSSETLKPCFINTGFFFNYAVNTLTYNNSVGSNILAGNKPRDRISSLDLSLGFGLTKDWDIGVSLPFTLGQEIKDPFYVSFFENKGLNEIRVNTKYRFTGDDQGGFAGVLSLNRNTIENNPFAGKNPGPTINLELVADTTYRRWAFGFNIGYRKRNSGEQLTNQPFAPLKDQWMYSAAGSYLFSGSDTKLIIELVGARSASNSGSAQDVSLSGLEGLVGIKQDLSQRSALHFGASARLSNSPGTPDFRLYAGLNFAFDRGCDDEPQLTRVYQKPKVKPYVKDGAVIFRSPVIYKKEVTYLDNVVYKDLVSYPTT